MLNQLKLGGIIRIKEYREIKDMIAQDDFVGFDLNGVMRQYCGKFVQTQSVEHTHRAMRCFDEKRFKIEGRDVDAYIWDNEYAENCLVAPGDKVFIKSYKAGVEDIINDLKDNEYPEVIKTTQFASFIKTSNKCKWIDNDNLGLVNIPELTTNENYHKEQVYHRLPKIKVRYFNSSFNDIQRVVSREGKAYSVTYSKLHGGEYGVYFMERYYERLIVEDKDIIIYMGHRETDSDTSRTYYFVLSKQEDEEFRAVCDLNIQYSNKSAYKVGDISRGQKVQLYPDTTKQDIYAAEELEQYPDDEDLDENEIINFYAKKDKFLTVRGITIIDGTEYAYFKELYGAIKVSALYIDNGYVDSSLVNLANLNDAVKQDKKVFIEFKSYGQLGTRSRRKILSMLDDKYSDSNFETFFNSYMSSNTMYYVNLNSINLDEEYVTLDLPTKPGVLEHTIPVSLISNVTIYDDELFDKAEEGDFVEVDIKIPILTQDKKVKIKYINSHDGFVTIQYTNISGAEVKRTINSKYITNLIKYIQVKEKKIEQEEVKVFEELAYTSIWSALERGVI